MIKVKGWHGELNPMDSVRMNRIATVVETNYIWTFDGTIGDFADKWKNKFLVYYVEGMPVIYLTSKHNFSTS